MYRSAARIAIALTTLASLAPVITHTQASDVVPAAAAGVPETPPPPRLLVMNNGDLMEGEITRTQTGYELARPGGGRMFLADSFVWFAANSRAGAYEELRKRFPDQSAGGHVALARWCLRYGLKEAAYDELQVALTIDPDHRDARNMVKILGASKTVIPDPTLPPEALAEPGATLGGLPPATARAFVTTVQPILVNGCGNASCHGSSSKNAFTIQNVRSNNPAFKALTQRNLETVRDRLSLDDPAHSDLFMLPQQPGHGGSRRPIFGGPAGAAQLRRLQAWAAAVGRATPRSEQKAQEPASLVLTSAETTPAAPADEHAPPMTAQTDAPVGLPDVADVLRQAIAEERADAFDPREFNRRFGPDAGRPTPPASEGPKP